MQEVLAIFVAKLTTLRNPGIGAGRRLLQAIPDLRFEGIETLDRKLVQLALADRQLVTLIVDNGQTLTRAGSTYRFNL